MLPSQLLARAVAAGVIDAGDFRSRRRASSRPASTCASGEVAYRIRCSFLPDADTVERRVKDLVIDELDLRGDGAVLETNRPYLIPLQEQPRPARPTSGARPTPRARPAASTSSPGSSPTAATASTRSPPATTGTL